MRRRFAITLGRIDGAMIWMIFFTMMTDSSWTHQRIILRATGYVPTLVTIGEKSLGQQDFSPPTIIEVLLAQ